MKIFTRVSSVSYFYEELNNPIILPETPDLIYLKDLDD